MASNRPTKKQIELLRFIDTFIKGNDYSPSYREIMRGLGYKSVSTVAAHVDQLVVKGYLERDTYSPRSLIVTSGRATTESRSNRSIARSELQSLRRQVDDESDTAAIDRVIELLDTLADDTNQS